jgi:ubiquinone/menaquinone biosynthesis C-methylase UbiE
MRPGNYPEQAETYDRTRGASPSVVRALVKRLGPAEGRTLLDVAGGTGNYGQVLAARGFAVTMVDAEPAMLARSVAKLGPGHAVVGDAAALPIGEASVDAMMIVSAIHLFDDPAAAFAEARRVIRDGPLVVMAFTLENLEPLFVYEYFEGASPNEIRHHEQDVVEMLQAAGFGDVERDRVVYVDRADGSLSALHTDPYALAGEAYLRNTSFWHRIDPDVRERGLRALHEDLRSGRLAERVEDSMRTAGRTGHITAFAATPGS